MSISTAMSKVIPGAALTLLCLAMHGSSPSSVALTLAPPPCDDLPFELRHSPLRLSEEVLAERPTMYRAAQCLGAFGALSTAARKNLLLALRGPYPAFVALAVRDDDSRDFMPLLVQEAVSEKHDRLARRDILLALHNKLRTSDIEELRLLREFAATQQESLDDISELFAAVGGNEQKTFVRSLIAPASTPGTHYIPHKAIRAFRDTLATPAVAAALAANPNDVEAMRTLAVIGQGSTVAVTALKKALKEAESPSYSAAAKALLNIGDAQTQTAAINTFIARAKGGERIEWWNLELNARGIFLSAVRKSKEFREHVIARLSDEQVARDFASELFIPLLVELGPSAMPKVLRLPELGNKAAKLLFRYQHAPIHPRVREEILAVLRQHQRNLVEHYVQDAGAGSIEEIKDFQRRLLGWDGERDEWPLVDPSLTGAVLEIQDRPGPVPVSLLRVLALDSSEREAALRTAFKSDDPERVLEAYEVLANPAEMARFKREIEALFETMEEDWQRVRVAKSLLQIDRNHPEALQCLRTLYDDEYKRSGNPPDVDSLRYLWRSDDYTLQRFAEKKLRRYFLREEFGSLEADLEALSILLEGEASLSSETESLVRRCLVSADAEVRAAAERVLQKSAERRV